MRSWTTKDPVRAIVIKHDKAYKEAQILIGDRVMLMPVSHLKKIAPQKFQTKGDQNELQTKKTLH